MNRLDTLPVVIAGCSRRKSPSVGPLPALDLYEGGCIPALRACAGRAPGLRRRIWILSALHGLLHAEDPVLPYDKRMDPERAAQLRPAIRQRLETDWARSGAPSAILVIAEPVYQLALADLGMLADRGQVHWVSDPAGDWDTAEAILSTWSLPCQ